MFVASIRVLTFGNTFTPCFAATSGVSSTSPVAGGDGTSASTCSLLGSAAVSFAFPAFVFAYYLNGFGIALQHAGTNGYVAALKDGAATKMGVMHALYGSSLLLILRILSIDPGQVWAHWSRL